MAPSWQDSLQAFLDNNPELPAGEEPVQQEQTSTSRKPRLDIIMEKKGRAGKVATIISGFGDDEEELRQTASALKTSLGTGGSSRGGEILIQGDRRRDVKRLLEEMGYQARII